MEQYFKFVYLSAIKQHIRYKTPIFVLGVVSLAMMILKLVHKSPVHNWPWMIVIAPLVAAIILLLRALSKLLQY